MDIRYGNDLKEFTNSLSPEAKAQFIKLKAILGRFGYLVRMPYAKKIDTDLYELRIRGKQEVRIFFTYYIGAVVLLHGFIKKTQQTPLKELKLARRKLRQLTNYRT